MVREGPAQPAPPPKDDPQEIPARKARGGEIILRTPLSRAIFIAGLVLAAVIVVIVGFYGWR